MKSPTWQFGRSRYVDPSRDVWDRFLDTFWKGQILNVFFFAVNFMKVQLGVSYLQTNRSNLIASLPQQING